MFSLHRLFVVNPDLHPKLSAKHFTLYANMSIEQRANGDPQWKLYCSTNKLCFKCGGLGHLAHCCPDQKGSMTKGSKQWDMFCRQRNLCFECLDDGHMVWNCPVRLEQRNDTYRPLHKHSTVVKEDRISEYLHTLPEIELDGSFDSENESYGDLIRFGDDQSSNRAGSGRNGASKLSSSTSIGQEHSHLLRTPVKCDSQQIWESLLEACSGFEPYRSDGDRGVGFQDFVYCWAQVKVVRFIVATYEPSQLDLCLNEFHQSLDWYLNPTRPERYLYQIAIENMESMYNFMKKAVPTIAETVRLLRERLSELGLFDEAENHPAYNAIADRPHIWPLFDASERALMACIRDMRHATRMRRKLQEDELLKRLTNMRLGQNLNRTLGNAGTSELPLDVLHPRCTCHA